MTIHQNLNQLRSPATPRVRTCAHFSFSFGRNLLKGKWILVALTRIELVFKP